MSPEEGSEALRPRCPAMATENRSTSFNFGANVMAKAAAKAKATESDSASEPAKIKSNKGIAPPSRALAATSLDTADDRLYLFDF